MGISLINAPVFSLADSPFRRKLESTVQSSLVDTNSSQNSSGEHRMTCIYMDECVLSVVFSVAWAEN